MTKVVDLSNFGDPRANDEKNKQTEGEEKQIQRDLGPRSWIHGSIFLFLIFFPSKWPVGIVPATFIFRWSNFRGSRHEKQLLHEEEHHAIGSLVHSAICIIHVGSCSPTNRERRGPWALHFHPKRARQPEVSVEIRKHLKHRELGQQPHYEA